MASYRLCFVVEATRLKEKGNTLFKQQKFVEAIDMYSAALELCPDEPSYHGNRAVRLSVYITSFISPVTIKVCKLKSACVNQVHVAVSLFKQCVLLAWVTEID